MGRPFVFLWGEDLPTPSDPGPAQVTNRTHKCGPGLTDKIKALFKNTFGTPRVEIVAAGGTKAQSKPLRVGVVLSGGQAPGGHNVIIGMFDQVRAGVRRVYIFCDEGVHGDGLMLGGLVHGGLVHGDGLMLGDGLVHGHGLVRHMFLVLVVQEY